MQRDIVHLPYYRQEQINARSGVHAPRATLASWAGQTGAGLQPLFDAHRAFVPGAQVLHADETPAAMLDPGAGKTKRAYLWACPRGGFEPQPGVVFDFCTSRAVRHPVAFLKGWSGTLVCDDYVGYDSVFKLEQRIEAGCMAHARRKFDELVKANHSQVAAQAVQRIAMLYRIEREAKDLSPEDRLPAPAFGSLPPEAIFAWPQSGLVQILSDDGGIEADGVVCKDRPATQQAFRSIEFRP